jgi:hypothetical protein
VGLITRGFAVSGGGVGLVTLGFAIGPLAAEVARALRGASSASKAKAKELPEFFMEALYSVKAILIEVNGKELIQPFARTVKKLVVENRKEQTVTSKITQSSVTSPSRRISISVRQKTNRSHGDT